jgi:hypothetical protein
MLFSNAFRSLKYSRVRIETLLFFYRETRASDPVPLSTM